MKILIPPVLLYLKTKPFLICCSCFHFFGGFVCHKTDIDLTLLPKNVLRFSSQILYLEIGLFCLFVCLISWDRLALNLLLYSCSSLLRIQTWVTTSSLNPVHFRLCLLMADLSLFFRFCSVSHFFHYHLWKVFWVQWPCLSIFSFLSRDFSCVHVWRVYPCVRFSSSTYFKCLYHLALLF